MIMIMILGLGFLGLVTLALYCCLVFGSDSNYYDEIFGKVDLVTHYNQERRMIISDWSE